MKIIILLFATILLSIFSEVKAQNSALYGISTFGGLYGKGYIYKINPAGGPKSKVYDFDSITGAIPMSSLLPVGNSKYYGMTLAGGAHNAGVIYEFDAVSNTCALKHSFSIIDSTGRSPKGSLMQASNGNLYGMTLMGGTNSFGVLFEYDLFTNTYTVKYNFDSITGGNPEGSLTESMGILYGLTGTGANGNVNGSLFAFNLSNNNMSVKVLFNTTQGNPITTKCDLLKASNGNLYGTSVSNGIYGNGLIFEYDPIIDSFTIKKSFNYYTNGSNPEGYLMEGSNHIIYGMCRYGGANSSGTFYSYNYATDSIIKLYDVQSSLHYPFGGFVQDTNGILYGVSVLMFPVNNPFGYLFKFNPQTATTTIIDSIKVKDVVYPPSVNHLTGNDYCVIDTSVSITTNIAGNIVLSANDSGLTYQWLDCVNAYSPIASATNQYYIPTVTGSYAVSLDNGYCEDTSRCIRVYFSGIESKESSDIRPSIFPNPSSGTFEVNLGRNTKFVQLTVYSILGTEVFHSKYRNISRISCQVPNLSSGEYIIEIQTDDGSLYHIRHSIY